jgi:hypothetical protein
MADVRNILDTILGGRQGFWPLPLKGGTEALTTTTTEALKRRARENLARERRGTQRRLEATPRWGELTPEQRIRAFETRDTDLAKRISERLKALESGEGRVTGRISPNVKLGIFPADIEAGLGQIKQLPAKQRLMELLGGQRSGWNPGILIDRITR